MRHSQPELPVPAFSARLIVALAAILVGALALARLAGTQEGIATRAIAIGETPATVFVPTGGGPAPVVVVGHGFSGSRPLMQPFGTTLARNGYVAVTYDSLGHGRNPQPMTGDITRTDGATRNLVAELDRVVQVARALPESDGRVALLAHSMAADIVVRAAIADPSIAATVAVSMFSPAPTAEAPANLLIIVGDWEPPLKDEALRVLRLAAGRDAEAGITYDGLGPAQTRRVTFVPHVEHIGVLYSPAAMREAVAWLDGVFSHESMGYADARGPWVLALILAAVALAWPLARLLPVIAPQPVGAALRGWRLWLVAVVPAVVTPLVLTQFEVRFLPVIVGDYIVMHFALFGLVTLLLLGLMRRLPAKEFVIPERWPALLAAALAVAAWGFFGIGGVVNAQVSSFWPTPARAGLMLALLPATLVFFLADGWATRGPRAPFGSYALTKIAFLGSLALAVALDLPRLFFLIVLAPALVLFFVVFGLISGWAFARTGHPFVGALGNAVIFALAIAVTFPMVAG